MSDIMIP